MPITEINDETVTELVGDAVAAPSMHNAQPWRFLYHRGDHLIDLCADPLRTILTADPTCAGSCAIRSAAPARSR